MKLKERTKILSNYSQKFSDFSSLMLKKDSDIFESLETYLAKYPEVDIETLSCLDNPTMDDLSELEQELPILDKEEELETDVSDEELLFSNEDVSEVQGDASRIIEEDTAYEGPVNNAVVMWDCVTDAQVIHHSFKSLNLNKTIAIKTKEFF